MYYAVTLYLGRVFAVPLLACASWDGNQLLWGAALTSSTMLLAADFAFAPFKTILQCQYSVPEIYR